MKKLTISALDSLFNYLNTPDNIFWIRDKSFTKQIYISPGFEDVWGIPASALYDDRESNVIRNTLLPNEGKDKWIVLDGTKKAIGHGQTTDIDPSISISLLLKIKNTQGQERFLIDDSYLLIDEKGEHLGFAGMAKSVTQEEWYGRFYAEKSKVICDNSNLLKKHIFDVLYTEAGITAKSCQQEQRIQPFQSYYVSTDNKDIIFTDRESQCIHYLKQGKSAKQTATILCLSPRTVEFHLSNACQKANCRTKLELSNKVKYKL